MGSIAIAQANKLNADKAQALDKIQSDDAIYQAREAGGMEVKASVENEIAKMQAIQQANYQNMDQNMDRGQSAFTASQQVPAGPSMLDEASGFFGGKFDNVKANIANYLSREAPPITAAEQAIRDQGAALERDIVQYNANQTAQNLTPVELSDARAKYQRSLGE